MLAPCPFLLPSHELSVGSTVLSHQVVRPLQQPRAVKPILLELCPPGSEAAFCNTWISGSFCHPGGWRGSPFRRNVVWAVRSVGVTCTGVSMFQRTPGKPQGLGQVCCIWKHCHMDIALRKPSGHLLLTWVRGDPRETWIRGPRDGNHESLI